MQNSQIHNLLTKGVSNVIDRANLEKRLLAGEKLRVKFGIDPTAAKIHIGHMVPFLKLKEFQALGHEIVLLFGDATAQVGDTSDKDAERPMLTREETRRNCEVFLQKFSKVIDISKINVYYNSEGLDVVNFAGVGELAKNFSVAEMLDRDNFSKRYKEGKRISLQEFLYPIMQGYDSVAIAKKYGSCDLELGGNDQYFNLLAGRTMMNAFGLPKQDIMTFDLLVGTDGKKMSKTSPNCILIDDTPFDMYQKLINVDDSLIVHYFTFATDMTIEQVDVIAKRLESGEHPNILKKELADYVVTMYHGKPYDPLDTGSIEKFQVTSSKLLDGKMFIGDILKELNFCATSGDVRNALAGNSVRVNGEVITDPKFLVTISPEGTLVEMGKKKAKRVFL
ncbi:MAG: tyrosine--tRNA ligase [Candidatus Gracilibacteria bacterium]|nr:tyrosine--tRNA ligase [Candidatus Gracilibacteria bacterium]